MSLSDIRFRGTLKGTVQRTIRNYNDLINKPAINGHTLIGNQSGHALGLANEDDIINVEANPLGSATADLHKILVDDTIYSIPDVVVYGTASGAIASFDDGGDNKPLKSLKVAINPVQEGSGDPSPSNVRPIRGWDKAEIHRADGATPHIIDDTYNITWSEAGEVFGGELDVTSGVLRVDRICKKGSDMTWGKQSGTYNFGRFYSITSPMAKMIANRNTVLSSNYKPTNNNDAGANDDEYVWIRSVSATITQIRVKDSAKDSLTAEQFAESVADVDFCYELATPQEIQLTPTEVTTLLGNNNIWSDTGDILECVYQRDLNLAFNELWDLVHSNSGTRNLSLSKSAVKEEETEEITEEPKEEEQNEDNR